MYQGMNSVGERNGGGEMPVDTETFFQAPGMMSGNNYSGGEKTLPYTGTISNIYRDFGVIDNEISFKLK